MNCPSCGVKLQPWSTQIVNKEGDKIIVCTNCSRTNSSIK